MSGVGVEDERRSIGPISAGARLALISSPRGGFTKLNCARIEAAGLDLRD
jgi:hypothetical protein